MVLSGTTPRPGGARRRAGRRAGFGLLEILIAVTVFVVAMGAVTTSLITSTTLVHGNREAAMALDAAQSFLARLETEPFEELYARYNDDPDDDPGGVPGSAPGSGFIVRGLTPLDGDADGRCGRVLFPGNGFELREDLVDRGFGTPRDLNGDTNVDGADHDLDYRMLPVRVVVDWTGQGGAQHMEFVTALSAL